MCVGAFNGHTEIVKLLVKNNADMNSRYMLTASAWSINYWPGKTCMDKYGSEHLLQYNADESASMMY